ncbi:MAG TPA: bile acid:sodium symporter family protein [Prolixibacteraceae bacterium]
MKKINPYQIALGFASLFLILSLAFIFTGNLNESGPLLILFFLSLAIGVRGFTAVKGLSYTIWIFTGVTAAMFFPQYFTAIGSFQFKLLIVPLLQIIMFGMGSQMSLNDFTGVIKMPKGVIIGVGSHYLIMPLVAFFISRIFNFPPEIAAGIILIGCVPSGLASNVMSYIAHANLALAVTIGAISTLISPFVTPLLMKMLGGQLIEVNFWSMMLDILNMIILPIVAGFIFNLFNEGKEKLRDKVIQMSVFFIIILLTDLVFMKARQADVHGFLVALLKSMGWFFFLPMILALMLRHFLKGDKKLMSQILSLLSMVGIAIIITIITATGRDSLLKVGALLLVTSFLHNISGYTLGYSVSWLFGMPEKDRRTVAFEVGMQNGGLASGLALQMGKIATVGLAPAIFGPLMNVTGSALASWWRSKPPKVEDEKQENVT